MASFKSNAVLKNINAVLNFNDPSQIGNQVSNDVQQVFEVNPLATLQNTLLNSVTVSTNTATTTLYTTPTNEDFYLTLILFGCNSINSTAPNTFSITAYVNGTKEILMGTGITAAGQFIVLSIDPVLKIDRGTNIDLNLSYGSFSSASVTSSIYGFPYDNTIYNQ
jgi:hypothetical protein